MKKYCKLFILAAALMGGLSLNTYYFAHYKSTTE